MPELTAAGTSGGQPADTASRAEKVLRQYRRAEARLTRRLRVTVAVAIAAAAFIVYAVGAGSGSSAAVAVAGTLTCLGAAGQIRASRNRVRRLLETGEAGKIARRVAAADASPQPADPPLFSQRCCRFSRTSGGGRLQAGPVPPVYLVVVRDTRLIVIEPPATPVMAAPAEAVEILPPRRQYLGASTALRISGQTFVADFTGVYHGERHAGFLRQAFTPGSISKSLRRGREVNDRFVNALLAAGATRASA
jgi:hypothetical protein